MVRQGNFVRETLEQSLQSSLAVPLVERRAQNVQKQAKTTAGQFQTLLLCHVTFTLSVQLQAATFLAPFIIFSYNEIFLKF